MFGILFYTFLCLKCGFVAGVFEINSGRYLTIPENSVSNVQLQVTTNVGTIPVPDGQPNTVAFSVIEQTPAYPVEAFYFWSTSSLGQLANQPLDYERHQMYQVVIKAVPRVGTTATQTLEVTVTDMNDYPSCQTNYNIAVTDGDTNDRYQPAPVSLVPPQHTNVNNNITTRSENVNSSVNTGMRRSRSPKRHHTRVPSTNSSDRRFGRNGPRDTDSQPARRRSVSVARSHDPDIVRVRCTDVDEGQTLTYTLDDNYNLFAINSNGTIGLASGVTVDRTELAGVNYRYRLGITATDNGSPPLSQTASATVTVKVNHKTTSDAVPTAIINVILTFVSILLVFALV